MKPPLRVVSIVLVVALCPSSATAQSGPRAAPSRFQSYNAYALDTLRIIRAFGRQAVRCGDSARHQQFTSLQDRFAPVGIRARELLDAETESITSPQELQQQWKHLVRTCVEFRREISPSLVTWASKQNEEEACSPHDWRVAMQPEIPDDILADMRRQASQEHPGDPSAQQDFVDRQIEAYRRWQAYDRIRSAPFDVYQFVRENAARDYPGDYATQLRVLDRQMEAYDQVQQYAAPPEMAPSDLFRIKEQAAADYPYDLSTQLLVIKRNVDKYVQLKRRGASGEAIVRYILGH